MGRYGNVERMVELGMESWLEARSHALTDIRTVAHDGNKLITADGHRFINMVSCSYLGLNRHPKIIEGAQRALASEGVMSTSVSRARIAPALLDEVEETMARVFGCDTIVTTSCSAAWASVLPIVASGHFTNRRKPLVIFDKNCHFSMNIMKASCGDETEVVTCEHNDVTFVEDACKKYPCVAYVADGAYSMGGNAPVEELLRLQDRYGLYLCIDDSHSISVHGERGVGLVRSSMAELDERTMIVGSLAKAFGATGGVIMLGSAKHREILEFCGGPLGWSQMVNAPGLGAILASAHIHLSDELTRHQAKLRHVMAFFDQRVKTANAGNGLPIRVIPTRDVDSAVAASQKMYERGFYTSAVFFPIVARGKAGLRVMGRADLGEEDLLALCDALTDVLES